MLGASRVDTHHRITLVKPVLDLYGINPGNLVVFCEDDEGKLLPHSLRHFITNKPQEEVKVNGGEEVSRVHLGWG